VRGTTMSYLALGLIATLLLAYLLVALLRPERF
jgi:K+-transporting ATPase KdpF subunit